jgi:hypothetical protein
MCLVWAILIQLGYALEQKNDPWGAILSITYKCFRWREMTYLRHSHVRGGWTPFHQWQGFGLQVSAMEGRWCSPSRSVFVLESPQAWMYTGLCCALELNWFECFEGRFTYVVNRHGGLKGVRGTQSPVEGYLSKCRTKIETELETGEWLNSFARAMHEKQNDDQLDRNGLPLSWWYCVRPCQATILMRPNLIRHHR